MSILDHAPTFTLEDASQIVQKFYDLYATAIALPSERDQNFLLETENGERFVLKIANATEERAMLETQNRVMEHLSKHIPFCQNVITFSTS